MSPEDAAMLAGQVQGSGQTVATFLDPESGSQKAGVKYLNGPLEGQFHPGSIVDALSEPQRGLVPVETFGQGASPAFGDRIAGIDYAGPGASESGIPGSTPKGQWLQYKLVAKKTGMYPVMTAGFDDPTDWVRLEKGDVWKFGQTTQDLKRYRTGRLSRMFILQNVKLAPDGHAPLELTTVANKNDTVVGLIELSRAGDVRVALRALADFFGSNPQVLFPGS